MHALICILVIGATLTLAGWLFDQLNRRQRQKQLEALQKIEEETVAAIRKAAEDRIAAMEKAARGKNEQERK